MHKFLVKGRPTDDQIVKNDEATLKLIQKNEKLKKKLQIANAKIMELLNNKLIT